MFAFDMFMGNRSIPQSST